MDTIAPEAIERRLEDTIVKALSRVEASDYLERIGAAPINDVDAFRHTPYRDNGHGCIIVLDSGEEFVITVRRMEER